MPFTSDVSGTAVLAAAMAIAVAILARTALAAWNGWLDLQRTQVTRHPADPAVHALGMIDLSDIKERLRKLEAIAAGVDL